jgi:hypothetical protein
VAQNPVKTKFVFWNLNRKPLQELLRLLVDTFDIDILIIAESTIPDDLLLTTLNSNQERQFVLPDGFSKSLKFFIRYPKNMLTIRLDTDRISIKRFTPPVGESILIVGVHFPSKMHMKDEEQDLLCTDVIRQIESVEVQENHRRTIVVGDFNMDPFSKGMISALGLHATMDKNIASKVKRKVGTTIVPEEKYYFYNPMWSILGDFSAGPSGSYYFKSNRINSYFWHMFDQVLIRPALLEKFDNADLAILTSVGDVKLEKRGGFPNSTIASDHFPLLFALNLA